MQEERFRAYLRKRYGEERQQVTDMFDDAYRVERTLQIMFDDVYDQQGNLDLVLERLRYSAEDTRSHEPSPEGFVVRGDPKTDKYYQSVRQVMSNLRCSVRRYKEFLDEEKKTVSS